MQNFYYTYVLLCKNSFLYVGFTQNLKKRIEEHTKGMVKSTKPLRPVKLIYYEACLTKEKAIAREKYLKTGFGKNFLKKRI